MSDSTKLIICVIGGSIITLFYRWNKSKIDDEQMNLAKLKNQKSIAASSLRDTFETVDDNELQLFVEGIVRQNTKLLKSVNKDVKGVLKKRSKYEIEIIEHNGLRQQTRRRTQSSIKTTDSFKLQSSNHNKTNPQLTVFNFSDTKILPKVLKYTKKDNIFSSPEIRTVMREPQSDEERQEFKSGKINKFLTTISKIGFSMEEEFLVEGTFICLYGKILRDKDKNIFTVTTPQYFGESKEQIIKYLEADQYFRKFIGILLAVGGAAFLIFGIKYFYRLIASQNNKKEEKKIVQNEPKEL